MKRESVIFAISGTIFGLLAGWIIGTQQAPKAPVAATAAAPAVEAPPAETSAPPLDTAKAAALEQRASAEPDNASVRVDLGNVYFDAQRFDEAIPWYEAAFTLDPKNVAVSTDLAVSYFYTNQVDRALAQLDRSLAIDPRHAKTLLNRGIVLAFGKRDLAGAAAAWEQVVAIAPDSEEGRKAKQGLDGIRAAHENVTSGAPTP